MTWLLLSVSWYFERASSDFTSKFDASADLSVVEIMWADIYWQLLIIH